MSKDKMTLPVMETGDIVRSNIMDKILERREWRMDPPSEILDRIKDSVLKDIVVLNTRARAEYLKLEAKRITLVAEATLAEANYQEQLANILEKAL